MYRAILEEIAPHREEYGVVAEGLNIDEVKRKAHSYVKRIYSGVWGDSDLALAYWDENNFIFTECVSVRNRRDDGSNNVIFSDTWVEGFYK